MLKAYPLLCILLFSLFSLPGITKADEQEWILHLQNDESILTVQSSSVTILEQENHQLKIAATPQEVNRLTSSPAVQYIEPNKQKRTSSLLSYDDPMLLQQWGLDNIQALPALEQYKQQPRNLLKGLTIGHEKDGQTFSYNEQPLPAGDWVIHTKNEPLSRISVTLDDFEGPWTIKILDEHGNLLAQNEGPLLILDVLLPKKQIFRTLHVRIEGTEDWKKQPSIQKLYGTNAARVAVIDSGISPHEDFCGNVLKSLGRDYVESLPYGEDRFGHGTFVTGIMAACGNNRKGMTGVIGNAPVDIIPLKVLDQAGNGDDFDISQAIYDAIDQEADIINMSLSGKGETIMLRKAVMEAVNRGILIVAAAGNDQTDTSTLYPASYPGVLTVTGTTAEHAPIPVANYGWEVDLSAPGANIISTFKENSYKTMRGTSLAAPYVSGAAALLKTENPELDAVSLRHALVRSSLDIGKQGEDLYTGYGMLQVEEARKLAAKQPAAIEWLTLKNGQPLLEPSSHLVGFSKDLIGQQAWLFIGDSLQSVQHVTDSLMDVSLPFVQGTATIKLFTTGANQNVTSRQEIRTQEETAETTPFQDVPASFWAHDEIGQAATMDIINGYGDGTFRPNESVSRRHTTMMLDRFFKWDDPSSMKAPFEDVPSALPGFLAVSSAYEQGIVKGYDQQFRPNGTLTRAQMALMLARSLRLNDAAGTVHPFQDVPVSHHAYKEIQQLTDLGIISKADRFRPNDPVTRAQLCAMMIRAKPDQ
ncbi:S8 family peptidase [Priestia abyssalis]|uniref:S8 family peptidase n=1 Tax=Priestia abyssalis TaxID=1221450 RepID=UPI00099515F1|nr:S8 family serine peptidase [Priestia abyssalis]